MSWKAQNSLATAITRSATNSISLASILICGALLTGCAKNEPEQVANGPLPAEANPPTAEALPRSAHGAANRSRSSVRSRAHDRRRCGGHPER